MHARPPNPRLRPCEPRRWPVGGGRDASSMRCSCAAGSTAGLTRPGCGGASILPHGVGIKCSRRVFDAHTTREYERTRAHRRPAWCSMKQEKQQPPGPNAGAQASRMSHKNNNNKNKKIDRQGESVYSTGAAEGLLQKVACIDPPHIPMLDPLDILVGCPNRSSSGHSHRMPLAREPWSKTRSAGNTLGSLLQ